MEESNINEAIKGGSSKLETIEVYRGQSSGRTVVRWSVTAEAFVAAYV